MERIIEQDGKKYYLRWWDEYPPRPALVGVDSGEIVEPDMQLVLKAIRAD